MQFDETKSHLIYCRTEFKGFACQPLVGQRLVDHPHRSIGAKRPRPDSSTHPTVMATSMLLLTSSSMSRHCMECLIKWNTTQDCTGLLLVRKLCIALIDQCVSSFQRMGHDPKSGSPVFVNLSNKTDLKLFFVF